MRGPECTSLSQHSSLVTSSARNPILRGARVDCSACSRTAGSAAGRARRRPLPAPADGLGGYGLCRQVRGTIVSDVSQQRPPSCTPALCPALSMSTLLAQWHLTDAGCSTVGSITTFRNSSNISALIFDWEDHKVQRYLRMPEQAARHDAIVLLRSEQRIFEVAQQELDSALSWDWPGPDASAGAGGDTLVPLQRSPL